MPRTVNGASSIIKALRIICRMVGLFGYAGITLATENYPPLVAAIKVVVAACQEWESLDNRPGEIDSVPPAGPEDAVS